MQETLLLADSSSQTSCHRPAKKAARNAVVVEASKIIRTANTSEALGTVQ